MPVQRNSMRSEARAIAMALVGVVVAIGLMWVFAWQGSQGDGPGGFEVQLGDEVFDAGRAVRQARVIDEEGPILYSDLVGGQRDIILQHIGDDPLVGWIAFSAQRSGQPRECFLEWNPDLDSFADSCDGTVVAADGTGQITFGVLVTNVEDGNGDVSIDLNTSRLPSGSSVEQGS